MSKKRGSTVESAKAHFMDRSLRKFGSKFLFHKSNYINAHTPITITCKIHGDFLLAPDSHIRSKYGCRYCAKDIVMTKKKGTPTRKKTTDEFIRDAKIIHGDKYSYEKTVYQTKLKPITITCREHGDFTLPQAGRHLEGRGCRQCYINVVRYSHKEFLEIAHQLHGTEKYDYSETIYTTMADMLEVRCLSHGVFSIRASQHLRKGTGCPTCRKEKE